MLHNKLLGLLCHLLQKQGCKSNPPEEDRYRTRHCIGLEIVWSKTSDEGAEYKPSNKHEMISHRSNLRLEAAWKGKDCKSWIKAALHSGKGSNENGQRRSSSSCRSEERSPPLVELGTTMNTKGNYLKKMLLKKIWKTRKTAAERR